MAVSLLSHSLLVALSLLFTHSALAETISGRVVGIADGDTITVLDSTKTQHKIRLSGIDAPEKAQPFGQASKKHLSDLVFNKDVTLNCGKTDRYKRKVCVVMINGKDVNQAQVAVGMAWWYRQYQKEQTAQQRADYEAAEAKARSGKVGLWSEANPVAPWEWRHKIRGN
ncbi:MAG: nuclease [Nitrososphaera sp.]|nr:nuclease [Nitrososphaera sp.]